MPEENATKTEELDQSPEQIFEESPEPLPEENIPQAGGGDFFSPMAVIMLLTAGIIDILGLLILIFGLDDFGILDFIGLIFVGGLMYMHSGTITGTKKTQELKKKLLKRLGLSTLVEVIPIVGSLSPSWTMAVFFHLKNS